MNVRLSKKGVLLSLAGTLALILLLGGPAAVKADTTYSYTGNAFTSFGGGYSCPPECSVSGSFSVATALAPGLVLATVTPTDFSFTDGNTTFAPSVATVFIAVSTDATGAITSWFVGYERVLDPTVPALLTEKDITLAPCGTGCTALDFSFNVLGGGQASVVNDPGTWTSVTTPEPASLALLGTALCGLIWTKRRAR